MRNKHKNRVKKFFGEWKQQNPQFFKGEYIHKDLYEEAVKSLLSFLRTKNVTLIDCNIELNKESSRSTLLSNLTSMAISWLFGFISGLTQGLMAHIYVVIFIILLYCIIFNTIKNVRTVSKQHLHETYFLQIVLQEYVALYGNEILVANKLVELSNNVLVNIPFNAESIYSERMRLSKYYQNAFTVTVNNNGQYFNYVVYSNSNNCSHANFVRLCKEQIGKNWNGIDKEQIDIEKAKIM